VTDKAKQLIRKHEGLKLKLYKDSLGIWTIGYGFNVQEREMPKEVAELWLDILVQECIKELDKAIPWWKQLSHARRDVLIDMCYNLGFVRLLGFKKFLEHLKNGNYKEAAMEGRNSKWANQVGNRDETLMKIIEEGDHSW
jgi:lysozyme